MKVTGQAASGTISGTGDEIPTEPLPQIQRLAGWNFVACPRNYTATQLTFTTGCYGWTVRALPMAIWLPESPRGPVRRTTRTAGACGLEI